MTPSSERNERQWAAIDAFFSLDQRHRRLDQLWTKHAKLRRREDYWFGIFVVTLATLCIVMTGYLIKLDRRHGPSNYDKVQLQRLIDGIN